MQTRMHAPQRAGQGRSASCLGVLLIPLFTLCLLGIALGGVFLWGAPKRAESLFGAPSPRLGRLSRYGLGIKLALDGEKLTRPVNPGGEKVDFSVALGDTPVEISRELERMGLIADAALFRDYLVYSGLDFSLQAGDYQLSPAMTAVEIAQAIGQAMQSAVSGEVTFVVLAGWRMEEIAASLPTSGLSITPEQFLAAARRFPGSGLAGQEVTFLTELPEAASAEGFLFPEAYSLSRQTSADELLVTLLRRFEVSTPPELRQAFARRGLTIYQAVTLAAIIEREAIQEDELPTIASVYLNRLAIGMKLDADPTVQYAAGYDAERGGWWPTPISLDDLALDSPYNTYRYTGLPPGPIANPGRAALAAVAYPAETPYFYFRAACDGSGRHVFAQTLAEQEANACP